MTREALIVLADSIAIAAYELPVREVRHNEQARALLAMVLATCHAAEPGELDDLWIELLATKKSARDNDYAHGLALYKTDEKFRHLYKHLVQVLGLD